MMYRYQLNRLMRGKARSLRADHDRHKKVAEHGGNDRDEEEKHHHLAVHGEELVVSVGLHQVAGRCKQFEPDQQRKECRR